MAAKNSRDLNVNITASEEQFARALDKAKTRLTQFERDRNRAEREMRSFEAARNAAYRENEQRARTMNTAHAAALREQEVRERALAAATLEAAQKRSAAHREVAQVVTAASAAVAAGLAYSAKEALGWQSAFAGVRKTVEGTPAELEAVENGLRSLTKVLPASHDEIAGVAEAAGQLGVAQGDVVGFTKVMIDLGETTNLTAGEAATSLARISNIMGTATRDVSRMGSTVVDLGNNSATTEREIVELATRLAAAGRQANLSEADIFAYASALTSVGVEAEAGGTAMSKVFTSIGDAVRDGGEQLEIFARVAGVSTSDFRAAFEQDAGAAIAMFVDGMGRAAASGESTTAIFDELELTDQRLMRAILSTGSASGLLTGQLDRANAAWKDNTALVKEAEQRYETAESRIQIAKNSLQDTAITLGETFLPMIASAADGLADFASWIGDLPEPLLQAAAGIAAGASALGLLGGGLVFALPKIQATREAFKYLNAEMPRTARGVKGLSKALGTAAIAFGVFQTAALIAGTGMDDMPGISAVARELLDLTDAAKAASEIDLDAQRQEIEEMFTVVGSGGAQVKGLDYAIRSLAAGGLEKSLDKVGSMFGVFDSNTELATAAMEQFDGALTSLAQSGGTEAVAAALDYYQQKATEAGIATDVAMGFLPQYNEHLAATEVQSRLAGEATDGLAGSAEALSPEAQKAADALTEADEALTEWREGALEAASGFVSLMDGFQNVIDKNTEWAEKQAETSADATDTWENFYDGQKVAVDDWIADLKRQVQEQKAWAENLSNLSERVNEDMTGEMRDAANAMVDELLEAGPESASAVAALTDASDKELERLVRLGYIRGDEVATGLVDSIEGHRSPEVDIDLNDDTAREQAQGFVRDWSGKVIPMSIDATMRLRGGLDKIRDATGFASGGKVPGTPPAQPGVDNVLAFTDRGRALKVRSGEWVINETQSSKQDRVLRMINSGVDVQKLVGLASGGRVDWAKGRVDARQENAESAKRRVLAERADVRAAERAVEAANKRTTMLRRRAADIPGTKDRKEDKRRAREAVRRAEDDAKAARKALAAEKKQLDAAEARLKDARDVREETKERASRLSEQTSDLQVAVRRGTIRDQATSGLTGGLSVVDDLVEQSRNSDLSRNQRQNLAKTARDAEKDLTSLYATADALEKQIAEASTKAQDLQAISDAVSSTLAGEQSLGASLGQKDAYGYDKPVTAASLVADARAKADSIKAFAGKLNKLRQMGLSGSILQEVAQLGSAQGGQVADALIAGGKGSVNQLNSAYNEIETWSNNAGQYVTEGFFNGGLQAANGLVAGLKSQQSAVEAQITEIALGMERALKQALGIASPSKEMAKLGVFTAEGLVVGIDSKLSAIRASASAMAQAAVPGIGSFYNPAPSVHSAAFAGGGALTADLVAAVRQALPEAMQGLALNINIRNVVNGREAAELYITGATEAAYLGGVA